MTGIGLSVSLAIILVLIDIILVLISVLSPKTNYWEKRVEKLATSSLLQISSSRVVKIVLLQGFVQPEKFLSLVIIQKKRNYAKKRIVRIKSFLGNNFTNNFCLLSEAGRKFRASCPAEEVFFFYNRLSNNTFEPWGRICFDSETHWSVLLSVNNSVNESFELIVWVTIQLEKHKLTKQEKFLLIWFHCPIIEKFRYL